MHHAGWTSAGLEEEEALRDLLDELLGDVLGEELGPQLKEDWVLVLGQILAHHLQHRA